MLTFKLTFLTMKIFLIMLQTFTDKQKKKSINSDSIKNAVRFCFVFLIKQINFDGFFSQTRILFFCCFYEVSVLRFKTAACVLRFIFIYF